MLSSLLQRRRRRSNSAGKVEAQLSASRGSETGLFSTEDLSAASFDGERSSDEMLITETDHDTAKTGADEKLRKVAEKLRPIESVRARRKRLKARAARRKSANLTPVPAAAANTLEASYALAPFHYFFPITPPTPAVKFSWVKALSSYAQDSASLSTLEVVDRARNDFLANLTTEALRNLLRHMATLSIHEDALRECGARLAFRWTPLLSISQGRKTKSLSHPDMGFDALFCSLATAFRHESMASEVLWNLNFSSPLESFTKAHRCFKDGFIVTSLLSILGGDRKNGLIVNRTVPLGAFPEIEYQAIDAYLDVCRAGLLSTKLFELLVPYQCQIEWQSFQCLALHSDSVPVPATHVRGGRVPPHLLRIARRAGDMAEEGINVATHGSTVMKAKTLYLLAMLARQIAITYKSALTNYAAAFPREIQSTQFLNWLSSSIILFRAIGAKYTALAIMRETGSLPQVQPMFAIFCDLLSSAKSQRERLQLFDLVLLSEQRDLWTIRTKWGLASSADPSPDDVHHLIDMVRQNDTEGIARIISAGGSLFSHDHNRSTALHVASDLGMSRMVRFLLARQAPVNAKDCNDFTPLHLAAKCSNPDIITQLLTHGAQAELATVEGNLPLHFFASSLHVEPTAEQIEILNALSVSSTGESLVNYQNKRHETPLLVALSCSVHLGAVRALLDSKADLEVTSKRGHSPLDLAILQNRPELATLFCERGAPISGQSLELAQPSPKILTILQDFKTGKRPIHNPSPRISDSSPLLGHSTSKVQEKNPERPSPLAASKGRRHDLNEMDYVFPASVVRRFEALKREMFEFSRADARIDPLYLPFECKGRAATTHTVTTPEVANAMDHLFGDLNRYWRTVRSISKTQNQDTAITAEERSLCARKVHSLLQDEADMSSTFLHYLAVNPDSQDKKQMGNTLGDLVALQSILTTQRSLLKESGVDIMKVDEELRQARVSAKETTP